MAVAGAAGHGEAADLSTMDKIHRLIGIASGDRRDVECPTLDAGLESI